MAINKDSAMLVDIQYIKPKKGQPDDYLYIIWKDLDTNEKKLEVLKNPPAEIYFEKAEYRNHKYNKNHIQKDMCDLVICPYKDINAYIAKDMGEAGQQLLTDIYNTKNYARFNEFTLYPYVFGSDYDPRVFYREKWREKYDNERLKTCTKGFLDIEVDSLESVGLPTPQTCPIDLVTLIDHDTKISYTFCLIGVDCVPKDTTDMNHAEYMAEMNRREMYAHRMKEQELLSSNIDEIVKAAHAMFDESYPGMEYKFYFYRDERELIIHLWQLINKLKLDFIEIWNASFDIPYFIERCRALGLDPEQVMCHPDFPVKECWFKKDTFHFAVKNKTDCFHCSSYTIFQDQMNNYAAIRKGQSELRSTRLTYIAHKEIGDEKLDYSEVGNIKTLSYKNYLLYMLYNIKDVLLQYGIEDATNDLDAVYLYSYSNLTPYESVFKQTVLLRNVELKSFHDQGIIPGNNINAILCREEEKDDDDDDDDGDSKDAKFEGALVGDPVLIAKFGDFLYGERTNSIFKYSIDFDMTAFYPSTIRAMNIDPSTLIFKMILYATQFVNRGGTLVYNGITDVQLNKHNDDSFNDDISKEVMDNFQTKNYVFFGHKWLNLPSVTDMAKIIRAQA